MTKLFLQIEPATVDILQNLCRYEVATIKLFRKALADVRTRNIHGPGESEPFLKFLS